MQYKLFDSLHYESSSTLMASKFIDLTYPPHWHADYEILYVLQGAVDVGINTEHRLLKAGDAVISFSNCIHCFNTPASSQCVVLRFQPEFIDVALHSKLCMIEFENPYILKDEISRMPIAGQLSSLFDLCCLEMYKQDPYYETAFKGIVYQILSAFLRVLPGSPISTQSPQKYSADKVKIRREILSYIENNLSSKITLAVISESFYMSSFYFSKKFKDIFGQNFKEFLNNYKISKAKNLLYNTNRKITDIAFECGYGSIRQFNRVFKNMSGVSPSVYREAQK